MSLAKASAETASTPHIPLRRKLSMVRVYASAKLAEQARSVAFITLYLALFQVFVLRSPILELPGVLLGVVAVVFGLACFMEGLFLGIMPLGERCGLRLPSRAGLGLLSVFALILGITATYAEPAIGLLRAQGSATQPWQAPLLYYMLNGGAGVTVATVAIGVGAAVLLGVMRFLNGWPLKPFLYVVIPVLTGLSWLATRDPRTASIVALAWDSGGITTGPVTVPLVIALGVGVSRIAGRGDEVSAGLGVVTFASALPVMAVLLLGMVLAPRFPAPVEATAFFAPENRVAALKVLGDDATLRRQAATTLAPESYAEYFGDAVDNGTGNTAPHDKRDHLASAAARAAVNALKAILPLTFVLLAAMRWIARERLPRSDEVALGLALSLVGLFMFGMGMEIGLTRLGRQTGNSLPRAWEATERHDLAVTYQNIPLQAILPAVRPDGSTTDYLTIEGAKGPAFVPFDRSRWEPDSGRYRLVPTQQPVAGKGLLWGYALALAFVFAMGVGATIAEPSLNAMGVTLEELTTGTYKRKFLVGTVAFGVGIGMTLGFARILFDWPLLPLLAVSYAMALVLTHFSGAEITSIAWDSAGVTTGPITVPLVIAAGVGIGERTGVPDAFGVLALASVFPILAVLASGIALALRRGAIAAPHESAASDCACNKGGGL